MMHNEMGAVVHIGFLEVCPELKHAMAENILLFIFLDLLNRRLQVTWPEAFLLVPDSFFVSCSIQCFCM